MPIAVILQLVKTFWWIIPIAGCAVFYFLWRSSANELKAANAIIDSYSVNRASEDDIHNELQELIIKRKVIHDFITEPLNIPKEDQHPLAPNVLDAIKRMRDNRANGNPAPGH